MPVEQLTKGVFPQRKQASRLHNWNEFPPSFTLLVTFLPSLPKASSYPSIQRPEPRPFLCCCFPSVTLQDQGLHNTGPCTHCRYSEPMVCHCKGVKPPSALLLGKNLRYLNRLSLSWPKKQLVPKFWKDFKGNLLQTPVKEPSLAEDMLPRVPWKPVWLRWKWPTGIYL